MAFHLVGYEYAFVEFPLDRLACKICHLPCRKAQSCESCGYVYCSCCLDRSTWDAECPICFQASVIKSAPEVDREVLGLSVFCPNKIRGCEWIGEVAQVSEHLFKSSGCVIQCDKCEETVHYTSVDSHMANSCDCYCQYCDTTATREVIRSEHKKKCYKFPLPCPNKCGLHEIPQGNMDEHRKMCPLEMIQCDYEDCKFCMFHKDRIDHKRYHWQLLQEKLNKLKIFVLLLSVLIVVMISILVYKQTEVKSTHNEMKIMEQSILKLQGKLNKYPETLWPALLFNFSNMSLSDDQVTPITFRLSEFRRSRKPHNVSFFAFKEGYQMLLKIYANGYGKGKGTHVSVSLELIKGPYDDKLQLSGYWPLRGVFTIELLNQFSNNGHKSRDILYNSNTNSSCAERALVTAKPLIIYRFIPHRHLRRSNGYIYDDNVYFKISYNHIRDQNNCQLCIFEYPTLLIIFDYVVLVVFNLLINYWEENRNIAVSFINIVYFGILIAMGHIITGSLLKGILWAILVAMFLFICNTLLFFNEFNVKISLLSLIKGLFLSIVIVTVTTWPVSVLWKFVENTL